MIKTQYLYYIKRKSNLIIIAALATMVLISYFATSAMKAQWIVEFHSGATDINYDVLELVIDSYSAITYINEFFYSDYSIMFLIIALAGFGVGLAADGLNNVSAGFGNYMVNRMGYKKYYNHLLAAQGLYIATILAAFFIVQIIITLAVFPPTWHNEATAGLLNPLDPQQGAGFYFLIWGIQSLQYIFYIVLSILIASSSSFFISNKYLIRLVPLILLFIPMIIGAAIGSMPGILAKITLSIFARSFLWAIHSYLVSDLSTFDIAMQSSVVPFMLLALFLLFYLKNRARYQKSYI
jgi:hypothetical protein